MIPFSQGQKIVFIGDSITDAGRRTDPLGLGSGYFTFVRSFLLASYPELNLEIVNRGIGGDTVRHLDARWQADVLDERPDWLSVKIGINDVWRAFGENRHEAVPVEEFEATYRRLVRRAVDTCGAKLIIAEPYVIEADTSDPFRAAMDNHGEAARRIAADFDAIFVPTQQAFDAVLRHTSPRDWAEDRIHPNPPGHAVIAIAYLRALGFSL